MKGWIRMFERLVQMLDDNWNEGRSETRIEFQSVVAYVSDKGTAWSFSLEQDGRHIGGGWSNERTPAVWGVAGMICAYFGRCVK
jgi:hypothetical protein